MPLVAAFIGYTTKLLAIEMIFRPIDFVGIKIGPIPIGWQGVLPMMAPKMASIIVDVLVPKIIDPHELVDKLDAKRLMKELREPLYGVVEQMVDEVAHEMRPGMWEAMPVQARRLAYNRVMGEAPKYLDRMLKDAKNNLEQVLDMKDLVVTAMTRDKALLNAVVRKISKSEFRFMADSGIYFGGLIGLVQMFAWAIFHEPIIMPLFGFFCGFVTDWLALNMIFRPYHPTRYFGVWEFQGLFPQAAQ
jgi:uncharacterized membrane protein YheB (UPF0754 family)